MWLQISEALTLQLLGLIRPGQKSLHTIIESSEPTFVLYRTYVGQFFNNSPVLRKFFQHIFTIGQFEVGKVKSRCNSASNQSK